MTVDSGSRIASRGSRLRYHPRLSSNNTSARNKTKGRAVSHCRPAATDCFAGTLGRPANLLPGKDTLNTKSIRGNCSPGIFVRITERSNERFSAVGGNVEGILESCICVWVSISSFVMREKMGGKRKMTREREREMGRRTVSVYGDVRSCYSTTSHRNTGSGYGTRRSVGRPKKRRGAQAASSFYVKRSFGLFM